MERLTKCSCDRAEPHPGRWTSGPSMPRAARAFQEHCCPEPPHAFHVVGEARPVGVGVPGAWQGSGSSQLVLLPRLGGRHATVEGAWSRGSRWGGLPAKAARPGSGWCRHVGLTGLPTSGQHPQVLGGSTGQVQVRRGQGAACLGSGTSPAELPCSRGPWVGKAGCLPLLQALGGPRAGGTEPEAARCL